MRNVIVRKGLAIQIPWFVAAAFVVTCLEAGAFTTFGGLSAEKPDLELLVLEGRLSEEKKQELNDCDWSQDREQKRTGFRAFAEDGDLPIEVRRWAAIRVADLHLHSLGDPAGAAEAAERWLAENPDDPEQIRFRCALAAIYEYRAASPRPAGTGGEPPVARFEPSRQERLAGVKRVLAPVFERFTEPSLDLAKAHWYYAYAVGRLSGGAREEWEFSPQGRGFTYQQRRIIVTRMAVETAMDTFDHLLRAKEMVDAWKAAPSETVDKEILYVLPGLSGNLDLHVKGAQRQLEGLSKELESLTHAAADEAAEEMLDDLLDAPAE
ncbi:MAG: hypothetical protein JXR94_15165 [Candidatus Hydrogenedentes bacterium]|nr:hypothetical protein [Candidatus Hydrogenedentota bacterium]